MNAHIRPWFPPGCGRGLLLRATVVGATSLVIAVIVWQLRGGERAGCDCLARALVYSLSISMASWTMIDPARFLLRGPLRAPAPDYWPSRGRLIVLALVGGAVGYLIGAAIGDAYAGRSVFNPTQHEPSRLMGVMILSLTATAGFIIHFRQRSHADASAREAQEARLVLMQSRLEPHLLFNALANLRGMIASEPSLARRMLDRLTSLLRATLNASRTVTHPLADEFARIDDYLGLLALRMGPRLSYDLALPDELRALPVPALLLQPLVENAVRHGLAPTRDGGHVLVSARRDGDRLQLQVRDTGRGLQPSESAGTGLGLAVVRARLQLAYGADATLMLGSASDPAGGTLATLDLPFPR